MPSASRSDNISGVRGVSWHNGNQKWYARIRFKGKNYRLGYMMIWNLRLRQEKELKKRCLEIFWSGMQKNTRSSGERGTAITKEAVKERDNMTNYSVNIEYDSIDCIYIASIPELQGCMAHGHTKEEAVREINIVKDMWIETARDMGEEIPVPFRNL